MAWNIGVGPATATNSGSQTSLQVTLNGCTAGRHLIVSIHWYEAAYRFVSKVECSGEQNLILAPGTRSVKGNNVIQIAYLAEITSGGNKTITVTMSGAIADDSLHIKVTEFSGGNIANFFNASGNSNGSYGGTLSPSVDFSTTANSCAAYVVAGGAWSGNSGTAGSGYTELSDSGHAAGWAYAEYDLDVGTSGAKSASVTMFDYDDWIMSVAAFNLDGNGGTPPEFGMGSGPAVAVNASSSTTVSVTLAGTTTGNHIVVSVHWAGGSGTTVSSITCSGESNLTLHGSKIADIYNGNFIHVGSLAEITSGGDKTITVTMSATISADNLMVKAFEFYGGDPDDFYDAHATANGDWNTAPTVNVTTGLDNAMIFVAGGTTDFDNPSTPGSNYLELSDELHYGGSAYNEVDFDAGSAGSKTANFTDRDDYEWMIFAVAFNKLGAGAGGNVESTPANGVLTITGQAPSAVQSTNVSTGELTLTGYAPVAYKPTEAIEPPHVRLHLAQFAPSVVLGLPPVKDSIATNVKNHKLTSSWETGAQKGAGQVTVGILNDHALFKERVFEQYRILSTYAGTISGLVKEGASPIARTVRAYRRSDGQYVGKTVSNGGTGAYSFTGLLPNTEYFVLAFDDDDPVILNAMVLDRILTIDQLTGVVGGVGHAHMAGHQPSVSLLVPNAYKYWRLVNIDVPGDYLQVSEIELYNDATNISSTPSWSSSFPSDLFPTDITLLFDGVLNNQATSWTKEHVEDVDFEIRFTFPEKGWINGLKQAGFGTSTRYMRGFTLQYSADGVIWTTFGSKSGLTYPGNATLSSLYTLP